jgi:hypothetical protein
MQKYTIEELLAFQQSILEMGVGKRRAKTCTQGMAIKEILEKQVAKKPTNLDKVEEEDKYIQMCPTCGEWAHEFYPDCYNDDQIVSPLIRCAECNQLFDWSDT